MTDRFREKLGLLTEELDGSLRSISPSGSRSPRRMSKSPRPRATPESNVAVTRPLIRASHPEIAAWPAPPPAPQMTRLSGNVRTPTVGPAPPSPVLRNQSIGAPASPISPGSHHSHSPAGSRHDLDNSSTLLSVLKLSSASREMNSSPQPAGRETELKRKIQTLEETVAEYERQKYNVMGTFSEYRERVAERERKLEAEYSSKIIALSEEVLGAKKDFEARMKSFQALQDKFEREKEQALEKLRKEHQKEIQLLEQRFSDTQLLNLEQKYILEIQRLEEERKSLKAEKERLGETFEMKLRRAQSLYETELSAAKMLYTKELEALRDHEEALKEELLARQDEFHDRLQELQLHSKRGREELASCKKEVSVLEKKLHSKEKEVQAITKELDEARNETNDSIRRLTEATAEFSECKQKFQQQEEELQKKTRLLNVVEAAKEKLESVISDLQIEVKALKNKVEFLEKERDNLQSQSESQAQLQCSQVNALEAVLESVTKEKETTKENYEGLLLKERQQAEAREHAMKKEFSSKLNELEEQYTSLKEELEESARLDKDELREATEIEIQSLRTEKSILAAEIRVLTQKMEDEQQDDITEQLAKIVEDTTKLTQTLENYRERINGKDAEIINLRKQLEHEMNANQKQEKGDMNEKELMDLKESHEEQMRLLNAEIDQFKSACKNEKEISNERQERIVELEVLNRKLVEDLETSKMMLTQQDAENETMGKLNRDMNLKEKQIEEMAETIQQLNDKLLKQNENFEQEESKVQKFKELEYHIEQLEREDAEKSGQITELHEKLNNMAKQVDDIKDELDKKSAEVEEISGKNKQLLQAMNEQTSNVGEEEIEAKKMEEIQNELRIKEELNEQQLDKIKMLENKLKEKDQKYEEMQSKMEELSQQLNEETTVVLYDNSFQDKLSEQEKRLLEKDQKLNEREAELEKMKAEMEFKLQMAEQEMENSNKIRANQQEEDKRDIQKTNEINSELQRRIEDLEKALDSKNDIIQQLEEKLVEEQPPAESHSRKRTSITGHGVFQNFVSQMKDKRDVASERSKKKEAEKKAEKEKEKAAKDLNREKSPIRAKSPGILTRLRDRSPAKSRSPNLETTPSTSSRNLLSPSDAEKRMERSSPSRPLFSRAKKEASSPTPSEKRPAWKF